MADRPRISISTDLSEGMCYGCGQNNPLGLKLSFKPDGKTARADFTFQKFHQGWPGVVHGGVITTILDEAMGWANRFNGLDGLTARLKVNFKRPLQVGDKVIVTSSVTRNDGRYIETEAKLSLPDGTVMAEGASTYVVIESAKQ